MLRIRFSDADLARIRLSTTPDPLWEIVTSLHRFQTRQGRWAHAHWYRNARHRLREKGLERALRTLLLPLVPRAAYFPDFLTPAESAGGLDAGLEAILATPPGQVLKEVTRLERMVGAPSWAPRLTELAVRREFVRVLRAYHEAVIAPYGEHVQARIDAERAARCRALLDGGIERMLESLGPMMRWSHPVLHVRYPTADRDLHLNGRGLTLVPSYFAWQAPVSLAAPELPPVLAYPLLHEPSTADAGPGPVGNSGPGTSLTALLGRTRALALIAVSAGATTGEVARAAGVSTSSASRHATALRDAGLLATQRNGASVLHTLTPAGAAVLRAATRPAEH